MDSHQNVMNIT